MAQFYKDQKLYFPIPGEGSIEQINARIEEIIDKELRKVLFNVVLLGYPGAGRGTQARNLARKYNLVYLSTGEMLKEEIQKKSALGKRVEELGGAGATWWATRSSSSSSRNTSARTPRPTDSSSRASRAPWCRPTSWTACCARSARP